MYLYIKTGKGTVFWGKTWYDSWLFTLDKQVQKPVTVSKRYCSLNKWNLMDDIHRTETVLSSQVVNQMVKKARSIIFCVSCYFLSVFYPRLEWYVVATPSTSESLVEQQDRGSSTVSWCCTPLQDSHLDSPSCILSPLEAQHLLMAREQMSKGFW